MSDLRARLRIDGEASGLVSAAGQADKAMEGLRGSAKETGNALEAADRKAGGLGRSATRAAQETAGLDRSLDAVAGSSGRAAAGMDRAGDRASHLDRNAGQARGAIGLLGGAMAAVGGATFAREITGAATAAAGLTLGMGAVTNGAAQGKLELAYAADEADRLGLVAQRSSVGLKNLAASTNDTVLEGQKTRDIWVSVSEAALVLGSSNEQLGRGMEAIQQISGKGIVSMEEVRGQLSEAIPGAMQIAARAMGLTTQEFDKLVSSGELLATDFLPKFAAQLQEEYGPAIDQYLTSPMGRARVEAARTETGLLTLSAAAGTKFMTGYTDGLSRLNEELDSPESLQRAEALGSALAEGMTLAADTAIVLVDNLDEILLVGQAIAGGALIRWLVTSGVEARVAAAAYLAKGAAARAASATAVAGATAEGVANTTLTGQIAAAAAAEVAKAEANLVAAKAALTNANAIATEARVQLAATAAGVGYVDAKIALTAANAGLIAAENAVAIAAGRVAAAQGVATASTTGFGAATLAARGAGAGLLGLVGGPWGAAFLAAGAAVWFVADALEDQRERTALAEANTRSNNEAMADAARFLQEAAQQSRAFGDDNDGAVGGTNALTSATSALADQTFRLASARAEATRQALNANYEKLGAERDQLSRTGPLTRLGRGLAGGAGAPGQAGAIGRVAGLFFPDNSDRLAEIEQERAANMSLQVGLTLNPSSYVQDGLPGGAGVPTGGLGGSGGRQSRDRSADLVEDLAREKAALESHAEALAQGEVALQAWRIAQAGVEAVARAGLAAGDAAAQGIRDQAEAVERLTIADERIEAFSNLARSADQDVAAMTRRSEALTGGREALEALRVTEAGLAVLAGQRVTSLEQLNPAERAAAETAIQAAEAKERQAIATEKAEAAAGAVEELDRRIASETRHAEALRGGAVAEVAYARAESIRQAVEQAGLKVTDAAAAGIIAKADALFGLEAATKAARDAADFADEVRFARLSNREREIALRTETLIRDILAQQGEAAAGTARAQAEAQARSEAWTRDWAEATGDVAENMRQQFIESGDLAFEDMGKSLEKQLRKAIYDAMLAKPINMIVNAVMGGAQNALGSLFGSGAGGGAGGIASLFGGAGGMAGMLPGIGAAIAAAAVGSQLSGSIAGALGGNSKKASQWGMLGLVPGLLAGLTDKADRPYARADVEVRDGRFVVAGSQAADGGDKDGITAAGKAMADQLNVLAKTFGIDLAKVNGLYTTIGKTEGGNAKALGGDGFFGGAINGLGQLAGANDLKGWTLGRGVGFSQGQDAEAITEQIIRDTLLRAINAGASDLSEAEKRFVAAAESLDEAIGYIEKSRGFAQGIEDMILQLTDPAAFEKKSALDAIEATYQSMKTEAEGLVAAGLISGDVLTRLDQLKALQVEDALKRLAGSAETAADTLAQMRPRFREWLDRQVLGSNSPLNPLEQRNAAFQQYEAALTSALGGDATALGNLTEYADRLLSADRAATADASARNLLFEEVMADIRALAAEPTQDPVVTAIDGLGRTVADPIVAAIDKLSDALTFPVEGLIRELGGAATSGSGGGGSTDVVAMLEAQAALLRASGSDGSAGMQASLDAMTDQIRELVAEQRVQNAYARQAAARVS